MTMAEAEAYMNEIDEIMEGIDLNNPPTKDAAKEAIKRTSPTTIMIRFINTLLWFGIWVEMVGQ